MDVELRGTEQLDKLGVIENEASRIHFCINSPFYYDAKFVPTQFTAQGSVSRVICVRGEPEKALFCYPFGLTPACKSSAPP